MGAAIGNYQTKSLRLMAIANELLSLAKHIEPQATSGAAALIGRARAQLEEPLLGGRPDAVRGDHPLWAELAREHYRSRRRREKIFGTGELFGEPAWDILLDLFIAAKESRRVSVMSACIGAAVPSTTALRWITALEKEGLLLREDDPVDARRTFVQLSPHGYNAMVEYFASAAKTIKATALARFDAFEDAERAAVSGAYADDTAEDEPDAFPLTDRRAVG